MPTSFDPAAYAPAIADLLRPPRLAPLGPGQPNVAVRAQLQALDGAFGPKGDRAFADACRAGLWLYHDFLDESHAISQELHTAEGSYWHAILHRREPDPSNAKYWVRRVGDHPVYALLAREASRLSWRAWDATAFVDECETHRGTGSEREALLREVQRAEWEALFGWCWERGS